MRDPSPRVSRVQSVPVSPPRPHFSEGSPNPGVGRPGTVPARGVPASSVLCVARGGTRTTSVPWSSAGGAGGGCVPVGVGRGRADLRRPTWTATPSPVTPPPALTASTGDRKALPSLTPTPVAVVPPSGMDLCRATQTRARSGNWSVLFSGFLSHGPSGPSCLRPLCPSVSVSSRISGPEPVSGSGEVSGHIHRMLALPRLRLVRWSTVQDPPSPVGRDWCRSGSPPGPVTPPGTLTPVPQTWKETRWGEKGWRVSDLLALHDNCFCNSLKNLFHSSPDRPLHRGLWTGGGSSRRGRRRSDRRGGDRRSDSTGSGRVAASEWSRSTHTSRWWSHMNWRSMWSLRRAPRLPGHGDGGPLGRDRSRRRRRSSRRSRRRSLVRRLVRAGPARRAGPRRVSPHYHSAHPNDSLSVPGPTRPGPAPRRPRPPPPRVSQRYRWSRCGGPGRRRSPRTLRTRRGGRPLCPRGPPAPRPLSVTGPVAYPLLGSL